MLVGRAGSSSHRANSTTPLPAPFWFIEVIKVLGFVLHMVPMNLWYAGLLLALHLPARSRMASGSPPGWPVQMPVIVALGINFGIVPLLFLQLAYNKLFYPATILMAWPWLGIIAMLIPAYYGVYIYAFGMKGGGVPAPLAAGGGLDRLGAVRHHRLPVRQRLEPDDPSERWPALLGHSVAGAATGTALNLHDPTLWPRWLLVFGLALGTTAVWVLFDAAWLAGREGPAYRAWAQRFALRIYAIGTVSFAVCGSWYAFGTWEPAVRQVMFAWPAIVLTALTALAPGLPLAWLFLRRNSVMGRGEGPSWPRPTWACSPSTP